MESGVRFGAISLDCAEPRELAAFYARLLDGEIAFESDDFCGVKVGDLWVSAQRSADHRRPTWPDEGIPQQIHLDLRVGDLEEGERKAIEAGATKAETQPSPERWRVLIDPAGHPFCVTTLIP